MKRFVVCPACKHGAAQDPERLVWTCEECGQTIARDLMQGSQGSQGDNDDATEVDGEAKGTDAASGASPPCTGAQGPPGP